ncbi:hypothetical protein JX266_001582 [Neoarthrinium moseri]|nr:hypothetical protein JX266_001582 [Neoarthrinium moseri]
MSERKNAEAGPARHTHSVPVASFPTHNSPRTWFLTSALTPLAIRLIRKLLDHGDNVVAILPPHELEHEDRNAEFRELISECKSNRKDREGWLGRIRPIPVVGTVEELSTTPATQNLVRDQFESIFFSQVNFIKAALPLLRAQHTGHVLILTSIGGHIGTPGMGIYTAATWALEGFCDSLAYEIAPFNIKVTIVQPHKEIQSLTNKIVFSPQLPHYDSDNNPAPSVRDILTNVLNLNPETAVEASEDEIIHRYPKLPASAIDKLVQETVNALTAIGGNENPPARHIVGFEGAEAVKEKLKTVTEELEDFVEASLAVDIFESELKAEARQGKTHCPIGPAWKAAHEASWSVSLSQSEYCQLMLRVICAECQRECNPGQKFGNTQPTKNSSRPVLRQSTRDLAVCHLTACFVLYSLLPIAPARVRALVIPVGQIKRERFSSFIERLNQEHVVHLRDISADGRPNRNMFSPLAFPDGAIFYDLITHVPPPSHLALSPFDLYREPLAVIAIADGAELEKAAFSKRQSANAPTLTERNIRTLYQELEELRDSHAKALTHQVLIFDYTQPGEHAIPIPEGVKTIPPVAQSIRTTMKTVMCDISSLLLAEMTTLAKSYEAMTVIDSPGHTSRPQMNGSSYTVEDTNHTRRNSQFAVPTVTRSVSSSGAVDKAQARMSMPVFKGLPFGSSSSTPTNRPTTPVRSGLSHPPTTFDEMTNGSNPDVSSPEQQSPSRPGTAEGSKSSSQDKVAVQGFGPGGLNERWRNKGKGRVTVLVGSLYLQAGRWIDALRELSEGATIAKSINDHLWHGKALDLITTCLFLLGWAGVEFQVPTICLSPEKPNKAPEVEEVLSEQPRHLRNLQAILPELLEKIVALYSRISGEQLPPLPMSETVIRFCSTMTALHICDGRLDKKFLDIVVSGKSPETPLTTSPRLGITPSRTQIAGLLFRAFPSSAPEVITTVDRALVLSGIASVMGTLGYHRKKAMVVRELVGVLIGGLIEARTRGAAEVGIHPAAGLVALDAVNGRSNGAGALELGEGDIEHGIHAFLGILCKTYGVVGFNGTLKSNFKPPAGDSDSEVIARIQNQSMARHYGVQDIKLNVLRACINFSEALPDFDGVLKFSADLLRTAGKGVAPGSRREDAAPIIAREEQIRLTNNIAKTSELSKRLGLGHLSAEFWDEFLIRGISLDPLQPTRAPVPHAKSVLPGANTARASQDVDPFIYNPFLRTSDKAVVERTLVTGEAATFRITLQNPYDIDVDIESIKLDTEGSAFESSVESTVIGPYRTQILKILGTPREAGAFKITGAIVRVRGCRERRFPIFPQAWVADTEVKIKGIGLSSIEKTYSAYEGKYLARPGPDLKTETMSLSAISAQPIIAVKSTTLPQSAIMILEGERQVFSVTLQNLSNETPADLLLFSFQDSTQAPLQTALTNRDATPGELYEYELVLAKRRALRLRKIDDSERYIAPGGTKTFEFEILGKPGLTNGTIQIDYAYLGVPPDEVKDKFHTRQVCLDVMVTVNASVELARMDILPIQGNVPRALWKRLGVNDTGEDSAELDKYCLLLVDLRNAWPSHMQVCLEAEKGFTIEEHILPGNTNRVVFPIPRVYLEDPHAAIPALNPSRKRQFVVSTSKITPETERANREAFWFRERILDTLRATWKTVSGPAREGNVELRSIRLTPRMIEAVKIDEVGIELAVVSSLNDGSQGEDNIVFVDEFAQIKATVTNRTSQPIYPTLRLMPALCHRPLSVALDSTRRLAWNGTLQQCLPMLDPKASAEVLIGVTALCRGEFEFMASVEETRLFTPPDETPKESGGRKGARPRSDTQTMMDAVLGPRERRIWHSRHRCLVSVKDDEDDDDED